MVSYTGFQLHSRTHYLCLNPCCSGRWSRTGIGNYLSCLVFYVLILVVVEESLVLLKLFFLSQVVSLNPCCSGRWSRTVKLQPIRINNTSLNPCCSGRWSRTALRIAAKFNLEAVLILVVVEDGLVLDLIKHY